jgi:hypothetical protein
MAQDTTGARGVNFKELGRTGLLVTHGFIYEEILRELQGNRWRSVVREMTDNDPIVGATLFAIEMQMRSVSWDYKAVSDAQEDQEAADFLRGCHFKDMSQAWPDVLSEIFTMLPWGWSWHEVVHKERRGENRDPSKNSQFNDGRIGWRKWAIRAQESLSSWDLDDEGGIQAMIQQVVFPGFAEVTIPIGKSVLFRTSIHKNNPEGRSVLRRAYRAWYFKKHIENIEGIGIERDLAGLPKGRIPLEYMDENAPADKKAVYSKFQRIVTGIRRDEQEGLILPSDRNEKGEYLIDVELMSTGGQRQFDTSKIINRWDQRIMMGVMADFLMLGHEKVGSFALSTNKSELFSLAISAWLDSVAATINRHPVPRLLRLNGMRGRAELTHGKVGKINLKEIGDYIRVLTGAGVTLDAEQQEHMLKMAVPDIPVPDKATNEQSEKSSGQAEEDISEE